MLPDGEVNQDTPLSEFSGEQMPGFLRLRTRTVKKLLKALDESSCTGPDLLPARVLKKCADVLALPIMFMTCTLLREGRWPACWRNHWVHSIYKKGIKAEAKNYRGVHLTAQLSKVVERAVATLLLPWQRSQGRPGGQCLQLAACARRRRHGRGLLLRRFRSF